MKRIMIYAPVCSYVFLALLSCQSSPQPDPVYIDRDHNARNSISYEGAYSGVVPAASGPGIVVRLILDYGDTFELQYHYIDESGYVFTNHGAFTWNDDGNIIDLGLENFPSYYFVSVNHIIQLDMEGKRITGPLEQNYILRKEI